MRLLMALGLCLVLLVTPAAAGADPPPQAPAASVVRLALDSVGGAASWSTCDAYPPPPGTECTETTVFAEDIKRQYGVKVDEVLVYLDRRHYRYEHEGPLLLNILTASVTIPSDEASFDLAPRLAALEVKAPVFTSECSWSGDDYVCTDGVAELAVAWRAIEDPVRYVENSTPGREIRSPSFSLFHLRGTFRNATATAELNGVDVPGHLTDAFLIDGSQVAIFVCAGGPHANPDECIQP